jgi:hypothetical protein
MRKIFVLLFSLAALLSDRAAYSLDQRELGKLLTPCVIKDRPRLDALVDVDTAEIRNPRDAAGIVKQFFEENASAPTCIDLVTNPVTPAEKQCKSAAGVTFDSPDLYVLIHVVKWSDKKGAAPTSTQKPADPQPNLAPQPAPGDKTAAKPAVPPAPAAGTGLGAFGASAITPPANVANDAAKPIDLSTAGGIQLVEKENWYVYHNGSWDQSDFTARNHVPGQDHVWLIYIHLNRNEFYDVRYDADITKLIPAPLRHLRDLAELAVSVRAQGIDQPVPPEVWGGGCIPLNSLPAQIDMAAHFKKKLGTEMPLGEAAKFDDEGPYRYDFSVGVPVGKISQLDFSSNDTKVGVKKIESQALYALFDYYPVAVDFQRQTFSRWPFLVLGVGLATNKPLDNGLVALGWGTQFASIYAGVAIVRTERPASLKPGDTATSAQLSSDLRSHRQGQFAFGLHLSARSVIDMLQKAAPKKADATTTAPKTGATTTPKGAQ